MGKIIDFTKPNILGLIKENRGFACDVTFE